MIPKNLQLSIDTTKVKIWQVYTIVTVHYTYIHLSLYVTLSDGLELMTMKVYDILAYVQNDMLILEAYMWHT